MQRLDVGPDEVAKECSKLLGIARSGKPEKHHRIEHAARYPLLAGAVKFLGDRQFAETNDALQSESVRHRHQHLQNAQSSSWTSQSFARHKRWQKECPLHARAHLWRDDCDVPGVHKFKQRSEEIRLKLSGRDIDGDICLIDRCVLTCVGEHLRASYAHDRSVC